MISPNEIPYEFQRYARVVGPKFTAVYFFDDVFWRVVIPLIFGENVRVKILESLTTMPDHMRDHLVRDPVSREDYKGHWADCMDFDLGRTAFHVSESTHPAAQFVRSMERDLLSTISDLSQVEPNSNAMHNARLATEKALKAFLCFKHGFTPDQVKSSFGHNLGKLTATVKDLDPGSELARVASHVASFVAYDERYCDARYSGEQLWAAYQCAQFSAASLLRSLTRYNNRAAMTPSA